VGVVKAAKVLSIFLGAGAAIVWFLSAAINIPTPTYDNMGPEGDFVKAFHSSSRLNQCAALLTGLSLLLNGLVDWRGRLGHKV
jgi:hypothetical protein